MHAWLSALAMAAPIACALTIGSSDREVVASLSKRAVVREWRQWVDTSLWTAGAQPRAPLGQLRPMTVPQYLA